MIKKVSAYRMYKLRQKSVPYFFLAPNMLIFMLYIIIPAWIGVYYSFTDFDGLNNPDWIGLSNYLKLFTVDTAFLAALGNTIRYVTVTVPLTFVLALGMALIIIQKIRGKSFFRAAYYWPVMISFIVVGVMWQWIFGDTFGLFNSMLNNMGFPSVATLTNKTFAWWAAVFVMVWSRSGYYMIMFVGGLLTIPREYYEAADMDGATTVQKFFYITVPGLKPTNLMVIILSTMNTFKVYPMIVSFTGGGPYNATRFMVQHIYESAFFSNEVGYASAMSVVMLVIVTTFSGIVFLINRGGANHE